MDLCTAGSLDMPFVLDLYHKSFSENIRKPFSVIERKAAMGSMEILVIRDEGRRAGMAIVAMDYNLVLLDYFAVSEKMRGRGIGSEALELLKEFYGDSQFFLETEVPEEGAPDLEERIRRKEFYLRNGMQETGIYVEIYGVKLELLATKPGLRFADCEGLYRELFGPMYHTLVKQVD